MDLRDAQVIRHVEPDESAEELVNEAKAMTWVHRAEHALLRMTDGSLWLVRGGADGIKLERDGSKVIVRHDGRVMQVARLAWHTHPRPTGPSDHDRCLLGLLGQNESRIYEMFGPRDGSLFRSKETEAGR